ncbi:bifunctional metallophosphatase/5'-nucleotidase [Cohnella lupini]|uniref:2',3'-cyclic-nucleotide 2'-phosphodiesterase/3'-nucleotidase n=1 Tax=Cohnella lupini TaxID=1294267 RepID=A0A3D9I094_9BACL|nr:5'-nucleotidase C-terminal domain-containing protein [Cohnella lupini]RED55143.1 2',3'-cyclic-nucleotide 2'-phosphodiesterase/3'-nucleotidase [Cohnella lupini]
MDHSKEITITILETSDLHGHVLPIQYADNSDNEVGLAKIATLIHQERRACPNVLLVDNGDLIQGTPLAYHHARIDNSPLNPMVMCLNELEYDAAVLGNHEFNYGRAVLNKAIQESEFPWLSANVVRKSTKNPYYGKPYLVKELQDGVRIGLLGLTTSYIPNWENPSNIVDFDFLDVMDSAQMGVRHLREVEGVDAVVVAYHGGFERDLESGQPSEPLTGENLAYRLCHEVEGIDVLLTGHQHRIIAEEINGITVLQPGHQGAFLGKATLRLAFEEGRWHVIDKKAELISVKDVTPDSGIIDLVRNHETKTQKWLDTPIGQTIGDMSISNPMEARTRDNAIIEFINKVQMFYGGVSLSNTALFDDQARGFKPNITVRDVVSNYIYPNTLKVIRVTGQDIKDALEQSAGYFAKYDGKDYKVSDEFSVPKPQHYNYDMWEGIDYQINISRPIGSRVTKLHYDGRPIDLQATFDVAMNNYRAGGGGNYSMFQGKQVVRELPTDISELLTTYILEKRTIEATVNANWEVVHD